MWKTFLLYIRYAAAEVDCMTALTLDPLYVKAYLRLGSAQFFMKKLQKAKETFDKVLQLEPQNKQAKLEIEKIEKVCRLRWPGNVFSTIKCFPCTVVHACMKLYRFLSLIYILTVKSFRWWFMPIWCAYFIVPEMISKRNDL